MVTDRQKRNWPKKVFERVDSKGAVLKRIVELTELETEPIEKPRFQISIEPEVLVEETGFESDPTSYKELAVRPTEERFPPTKKQLQAKLRFHKYAPTGLILHLLESDPTLTVVFRNVAVNLLEYVGQISEEEFESWLKIPGFWPWFIADDDTDADLYHAKRTATDFLLSVMDLPSDDPKMLSLKVKVAETILRQNQTVKIEKKTVNINANVRGSMPAQFKRMDTLKIEQRIKQLKEHEQ